MTDRPILLNTAMVRAVLAGQKTQTRRPILPAPEGEWVGWRLPENQPTWKTKEGHYRSVSSPVTGDRLWVRETFAIVHPCRDMETGYIDDIRQPTDIPKDNGGGFWVPWYRADWNGNDDADRGFKWIPSIHMPCWASRITLPLVSVRVERVQDINEKDAWAEGLRRTDFGWSDGNTGYDTVTARDAFRELWDSIYGTWDANPWVWVAEWENAEVVR